MSRVLAFDTSGAWCTAALLIGDRIVALRREEMEKGQAERLMPMLEEVLVDEGAVWEELDAIAVGVGPGNFTGVRIAVSAARGLSLALSIPSVGVTAFEAMRGTTWHDDRPPMIVSVHSAQRHSDVFVQYFEDAAAVGSPLELKLFGESANADTLAPFPRIAKCLGAEADAVDDVLQRGKGGHDFLKFSENHRQVDQIARVAAVRLQREDSVPRPAPLYIRPADAAPPSDPPPKILS